MTQIKFKFILSVLNTILSHPDTELKEILLEGIKFLEFDPKILEMIEWDIDHMAKQKKVYRLEEKTWYADLTGSFFTVDPQSRDEIRVDDLILHEGRPRKLDAEATFLMMLIRAHLDSVTSISAVDRMVDSRLVNAYFECRGMHLPSSNTILDHVNAVSNETRNYIFQSQLHKIMEDGWDPMKIVAVDSFSVSANTDWPTDSRIILGLLRRAYHRGCRLAALKLPGFTETYIPEWLKELKSLDFQLACTGGKPKSKGKIKKLYRRFLKTVKKILARLTKQYEKCEPEWSSLSLPPQLRRRLDAMIEGIAADISGVVWVYQYASDRVFNGISLPSPEKILSLSDECASFIKKGNRELVIGYKPQVSRSGDGFITAFEIMEGNPKDSTRLQPVIEAHIENTGTIPDTTTTDDGYSSKTVRKNLLALNIKTVSMNGSKGKRITSTEDWESEEYESARDMRSAVESLIFTLRFKFHLYRFSRRGIEFVTAELIEKIIAYNLWRIAHLRKKRSLKIAA